MSRSDHRSVERREFHEGIARAVKHIGGDRTIGTLSGVSKSVWYGAKKGLSVPDETRTWPRMRDFLVTLPVAVTDVWSWDDLYEAVRAESGLPRRRASDHRAAPPAALPRILAVDQASLHVRLPAVPRADLLHSAIAQRDTHARNAGRRQLLDGVGWVVFAGGPIMRAAVAVTVVWWMLIGGAYWATTGLFRGGTGDASMLEKRTWIPRVVWDLGFAAVGIVCVWVGGKLLLRP